VLGLQQFFVGGAGREPVQFVFNFIEARPGDLITDIGVGDDLAGAAECRQVGIRRIGVTLVFADIRSQTRTKQASINGGGDLSSLILGVSAKGPEACQLDGGLHGPRAGHYKNGVLDCCRRIGRGGDRGCRGGFPPAQRGLHGIEHFLVLKIAHCDQHDLIGAEALQLSSSRELAELLVATLTYDLPTE
jgi:hypothetical protein